jgi:hypothetical protein
VGSGPTIWNCNKGSYIDSFKNVIRFPHWVDWLPEKHQGKKTTFLCSSLRRFQRIKLPLKYDCFLWTKYSNNKSKQNAKALAKRHNVTNVTQKVHFWQKKLPVDSYKYLSHGTAAVVCAASILKKDIVLFGCDNLSLGQHRRRKYHGAWEHEKRPRNNAIHSFHYERKLVDDISNFYNVEVNFE